jgi:hypothetical protein
VAVHGRQASGATPHEIAFEAPAAARAVLARLGRTEDVRISPSGRRLAIAGFAKGRLALADVEISADHVAVAAVEELESPALRDPHGLDFVDEDTLVVGDRGRGIAVLDLRSGQVVGESASVHDDPTSLLSAPGSVAVRADGGRREVLACNNYAHTVTRHTLDGRGRLVDGEVVARKWLDIPDGLALSADGRWLAVSNHDLRTVFLYEYASLGERAEPVGILRGVNYPHGIRFVSDDRFLVVADAGAPYVHVFEVGRGGWEGVGYPAATVTVMDDEIFRRGRHNIEEGGPKGVDVAPGSSVLVVTAECLPLGFFDLAPALDGELRRDEAAYVGYETHFVDSQVSAKAAAAAESASLRTELATLHVDAAGQAAALNAEVERREVEIARLGAERDELRSALTEASAALDDVLDSRSWRLTAPLRAGLRAAGGLTQRVLR